MQNNFLFGKRCFVIWLSSATPRTTLPSPVLPQCTLHRTLPFCLLHLGALTSYILIHPGDTFPTFQTQLDYFTSSRKPSFMTFFSSLILICVIMVIIMYSQYLSFSIILLSFLVFDEEWKLSGCLKIGWMDEWINEWILGQIIKKRISYEKRYTMSCDI